MCVPTGISFTAENKGASLGSLVVYTCNPLHVHMYALAATLMLFTLLFPCYSVIV